MRMRMSVGKRRMLYIWLLLISLGLVMVGLSDLFHQDLILKKPGSLPHLTRILSPGDLEILVESHAAASELGLTLAPFKSFQEEQLLLVPSTINSSKRRQNKVAVLHGATENTAGLRPQRHRGKGDGVRRYLEGLQGDGQKASMHQQGVSEGLPDRIFLHRSLPEMRHPECLGEQYSESLPKASVVICIHDDSWAALLRTVHSVLETTPRAYLQEVLVVDDQILQGHPKTVLSEYVSHLDGVRLIRSTRHLGVCRCRTEGATHAVGEVLVFMDSHCECQKGWLEPLLERVAQDRTRVVSPIMDVIDWQTYQYNASQWPVRGVFDWRLDFHWESNPQLHGADLELAVEPVPSPALGGEVLAINREFFQTLGAYDPKILQWGPGQTEFSIRVWSCGGSMEVVPCSRVAHLIRKDLQSNVPDPDVIQRSKIQVADTWMDTFFRKIFYRRDTLAHFIRQSERPNITESLQLKRSLGCRSFRWFLSTAFPQLYIPQDRPGLSGELYNVGTGSCLDYTTGEEQQGGAMKIAPCSGTVSQHCELNSNGELRWGAMGSLCLDVKGDRVVLSQCPAQRSTKSTLQWKFNKVTFQLIHQKSQLCVEALEDGGTGTTPSLGGVFLRQYSYHPRQQWHFEQPVAP
ncbi:polypeptide N-acetylgalactosaminyltransferase 15-like [Cyprinodon tularosa]|uniref:polypeptide N-acetylgalactosaminyltransferase 15-like n=1 Tax=Cyprinodon tularosa TaxID=77115 RepID=UPI0018E25A8B|nr:polypeptide N-acetylgalactosaminyltransferase 15-like [Cyprinodon tularosa]